jgi:hypothetical protein
LKKLLVKVLIYRKRSLGLGLKRRIVLDEESITVEDRIQGTIGEGIETLRWVDVFTTIHMGSSRYFVPNDLKRWQGEEPGGSDEVDVTRLAEGVSIRRTVRFDDNV